MIFQNAKVLPYKFLLTSIDENGWAAGLVLLTDGIEATGSDSLLARAEVSAGNYRFFVEEIINQTSQKNTGVSS